jgi:hypothetical protein
MSADSTGRQCAQKINRFTMCFRPAVEGWTYCEAHFGYEVDAPKPLKAEIEKAFKERLKQESKARNTARKAEQKAELDVVLGPIRAVRHQLALKSVQGRLSSSGLPKALCDALDALVAIPEDQVRKISLSLWGRP